MTKKKIASQIFQVKYICVKHRPDICTSDQQSAPKNILIDEAEFKSLQNAIDLKNNPVNIKLNFVKFRFGSVRMVVLSEASFANTAAMKSQLEFVKLKLEGLKMNFFQYYGSSRCNQSARLVTAAKFQALVREFDHAHVIHNTHEALMQRLIEI